ncbi:MAG: AI-2E family transporter, partial [Actinomycetota bacterium]
MDEVAPPSAEDRTDPKPPLGDHSWVTRAIVTFLLGALALVVLVWLVMRLGSLLLLLIVAFFFSFAMEPAVTWLARRGWRRGAATGVVMLGIFVFTMLMLLSVGGLLFDQAAQLVESGPELIQDAVQRVNAILGTELDAR